MWPRKKTICLAFSTANTWDSVMTMIEGGREDPLEYSQMKKKAKKEKKKKTHPHTLMDTHSLSLVQ